MTTPPVMSITDEQLAELESAAELCAYVANPWRFEGLATQSAVSALITRLREAEADAKRYRWLKDNVRSEFFGDQLIDMFTCSGPKIDRLVDAAMERTQ